MSAVFLDTVGLLAVWDTSDQWHGAAEIALASIARSRTRTITTTFVLLECGNAASRRPYRQSVLRLRERLERHSSLIRPTDDDWSVAWAAYGQGGSSSAGIVDHVSFVIMRRLGISRAFTNDRHFRAAGFETMF